MPIAQGSSKIVGFTAHGLPGGRSYKLDLTGNAAIIVGPNGSGKSTFLNAFYLFISRQWHRLNEYDFTTLILHLTDEDITINRLDVLAIDVPLNRSPLVRRTLERLSASGATELLFKEKLDVADRARFSESASLPLEQVTRYWRMLKAELAPSQNAIRADKKIQDLQLGQILYLPTYRRIEKDIKSIFPDIEVRMRNHFEESVIGSRSGQGFREIAGFGMSDIDKLIKDATSSAQRFQQQASESASQQYIKEIVKGSIKKYSLKNIRKLDDSEFDDFYERLDSSLFSQSDRDVLREKISDIRQANNGQPSAERRYLGMFVEKLLAAHKSVKEQEKPLQMFVSLVNKYLQPTKKASMPSLEFCIHSEESVPSIPLDMLSSGEKQIISIFAHLLLSGHDQFFVFIDEPELSLSVPWQKTFLPDIISTGKCAHLLSVTHSPFVFDNNLGGNVIDVRKLRVADHG
jgi:AAA15 family ATPase/GTPase